jgi:predicted permease
MLHDLRHAVRMLFHTKGWTAVVLISLALGIGANTALFTAVNGLMLQTVALPNPESLVRLKWYGDNDMMRSSSDYGMSPPHQGQRVRSTFSYATYQALRTGTQTTSDLAGAAPLGSFNVVIDGQADLASSFGVSGNYFAVLRVPVALGRGIEEADDRAGAEPVAVISHAFWRRRFGSDPAAIGRSVRMNNTSVQIIGVTTAAVTSMQRLGAPAADVTIPLNLEPALNPAEAARLKTPTNWWILVMGRLKPGATYAQVMGNLEGTFQASAREGMESYMSGLTAEQARLSTNQRDGNEVPRLLAGDGSRGFYDTDATTRRSATVVSVVVALLLLIVCANVANLLLSRASARHREISVRLSMGASRGRLVRQLLTESLLLSGAGGALGILVGYWSKQLLPFGQNAEMDWRVLVFVAAVSVLTGVVFGLVPALRATHVDLAGAMKESGRSVIGSRTWLSRGLLVLQVAVSLVLLIGAGLFLRTLHNLRSVDVGFNPNNLLIFRISPQLNRYDADRTAQLLARMQTTLSALPGVTSVARTQQPLLSGGRSIRSLHIQGSATAEHEVYYLEVSPEYFATMEIPMLLGRTFAVGEMAEPMSKALINDAAAKKFFPNQNPIGRRVGDTPEEAGQTEIIGVVGDTRYDSVREAAPPTMFRMMRKNPRSVAMLVRTAVDPAGMIETVRGAMHGIDPDVPVTGMSTQTEQIEGRFAQERLFALAYSLFGGLALLLACVGLFGLMSYSVSRRTSEIGIRMALGAQRAGVVGMVLRESMILVAVGVALGLAGALAAGRLVNTVLFGLTATDVVSMVAAVMLMAAVSLAAGYFPARRASRVDPMTALRYE